jgi:glycosyltransferase involved in cell wall biosynthesis
MNKNKKLLILINDLNFFCSHRLPIAEASKINGFDVVIGYGELGSADPKLLKKKGFKLIFVPMERGGLSFFKDLKNFFYIWNFFKSEKPDIAHLVTIKPYLYGGIVSRLTGIPSLVSAVSGLGTLFVHKNLKSKFFRFLLYPIYRWAFNHSNQKVIMQNEDDAKLLVEFGVLNPLKIKLIKGSGVKLEQFSNFIEPSGIPVVCFAARLLRDKGIYEYVDAARLIKERGIQARFLLAGDIDVKNPSGISLKELDQIKKKNYVEIIGHRKDIPTLYANSNIICLPSYREGLPKSLIEAAAACRAVVTTDVPGCRDAIIPNKTGLLVPINDSKKLADALQWLIEHPLERIEMGKKGRKFAEKEFAIEKVVQCHLNIYKELINK